MTSREISQLLDLLQRGATVTLELDDGASISGEFLGRHGDLATVLTREGEEPIELHRVSGVKLPDVRLPRGGPE